MDWWQTDVTQPELPDATDRRRRTLIMLRAILAAPVHDEDRRWFLTHALRRHSELRADDRWERTIYRTHGALTGKDKPQYEHVVDNRWFCRTLLANRARWSETNGELESLMQLQTTCLISKTEHAALGDGFGWARYLAPRRVAVHDCRPYPFTIVDLGALAAAQEQILQALRLH